ncbi:hypothetical protein JTE90_022425 [Oedothorax gibbosus]|uniref:Uncharacterized protein n=1 Tax=Oedothorax gibbosus TaxID=931172 RepID=A0AAV6TRM5_9ARAC|nr:hypothetical protein JTE90_022425 [Oedothorax gibbosus]
MATSLRKRNPVDPPAPSPHRIASPGPSTDQATNLHSNPPCPPGGPDSQPRPPGENPQTSKSLSNPRHLHLKARKPP